MAAPLGNSAPSKADLIAIKEGLDRLIADGIVLTSTTAANILVALAAEILAR